MALPRGMTEFEAVLREQQKDPTYSLLADILTAVNDENQTLSDVAARLNIPRPTLDVWIRQCGYVYRPTRRLVPIVPVVPAETQ